MMDVSPNDGTTVLKYAVDINKLGTSHSKRCVTATYGKEDEYVSKLCYFLHVFSGTQDLASFHLFRQYATS